MSDDLNEVLRNWPYKPGQLQVRKIQGADGRTKIQLRLDMGVLQMESEGRPDGQTPHEMESLLEYQRTRANAAEASGDHFELTADEVGELQVEGIQYYHRYIALFQIEDWKGVVRDTRRNLEMFSFVSKYSGETEVAWSVEQFRPYVLMMNTRAKANLALGKDDKHSAIVLVEKGIEKIERFLADNAHPELAPDNAELNILREWLGELRKDLPATPPTPKAPEKPVTRIEKLRREMDSAVRNEHYEKAAELRDTIKALQNKG